MFGGARVHIYRGKMREEARRRDSACFSHSDVGATGSLACAFQDGLALAYANQELQGDEDVVEAVSFTTTDGLSSNGQTSLDLEPAHV